MPARGARKSAFGLCLALACGHVVATSVTLTALDRQPGLSILAPTQAQEISGQVSLWAAAEGVETFTSLRFQVDGKDYGQPITSGLYRTTWNSTQATDGPHVVQAIGQDKFGNTVLSSPVTFFVNNFAPLPTPSPVAEPTTLPPTPIATPVPATDAGAAMPPTAAAAPSAAAVSASQTPARPVSCKQPDPFKAGGGIGMCVGGEWVLLWKPRKS